MSWPDGRDWAEDDAPTIPVLPPVRDDPDGVPGLHYMPRSRAMLPGNPTEAPAPSGPRRPWAWLAGVAAVAVLGAVGVAWTFGRATDPPPHTPAAAAPATTPTEAPTEPFETTGPGTEPATTPSSSLSLTTPPVPSATTVVPTPRPALVRVPGVVGDRPSGAQSELRGAGFQVDVRTVPVTSRRQDRRVVAQLPPGGTLAPAGSTVVLLVGEHVGDG